MNSAKTIIVLLLIFTAFESSLYSQTITNPRTPAEFETVKGVVVRWDEKEYYQIFSNVQIQGWTSYWTGRYQGTMNTQATIVREALNEGIDVYVIDDTSHTGFYGTFLYSDYNVADTLAALGIPSSPNLHIIPFPAIDNNNWKVWVRDWGTYNVYKNQTDSLYLIGRNMDTTIGAYLQKPFIINNVMDGGNFMTDGHGRLICDQFQPYINQDLFGINDVAVVANYKIHIDYYMKLINEETFIVNEVPASNHNPGVDTFFGDSVALEGAIATMRQKTSCFGRPYKFVRIRTAPTYNQNGITYHTSEAGYANSLILNKTVLVPMYDNPATDTVAINTYKNIMPGYRVVGIQAKYLVSRQGAIHCLTKELAADEPLFIAHAWLPDTMENSQNMYEIKAYIKTLSGISHAEVNWSTDPQSGFQAISMTQTVNDTFVAFIPGQPTGSTLSYYISSTANNAQQAVKPVVAPSGYYSTFLKTPSLLATPNLIGWTGSATSPTLYWGSSFGASTYQLQVATDQLFANILFNYPALTDTFQTVGPVSPGPRYYSRVAAIDSIGTIRWSNIISFDVDCPIPDSAVLRDNFNRADSLLSGTSKWSQLLNHPGGGSINVVNNAMQTTGTNYTSNGIVWDTLMSGGSEASLKIVQKSNDFTYSSLFIYARMNNKDYNTGTGYRLRYWEQSGADLIEIHRVGSGYGNFTVLASATREINAGDIITFRILCDNTTMVGLVNGVEVVRTTDATYMPAQWYFAFRSYLFPTPARFDDFVISSEQEAPPTPPGAPALLSPANNVNGIIITPTLIWNSSISATSYRIQLSLDSMFASTVKDTSIIDTSVLTPTLLNNTKYYWRVNGTSAAGTGGWSSPLFSFTTIVAPPSTPVLTIPVNSATAVPVNTTLQWNISNGATSYHLQLATDSIFSSIMIDSSLIDTSLHVSALLNDTKYYWRVSASNAGGTSNYSTIGNFTTIIAAPSAPILATPVNNATGVPTNMTMNWNISIGATSYRLQLATDSVFSSTMIDSSLAVTSLHTDTLLNNTKYYWRVNASNAGGTGSYSTIRNFTTIVAAPSAPVLTSPANDAADVPINTTLNWSNVNSATSYHVQLATDSIFSSTMIDSSLAVTSLHTDTLLNNTKYYWRVNASNAGGTGSYSTIRNFTTIVAAPSAPVLATPVNDATGIPATTTLSWNNVNSATSYHVQLATDSIFSGVVIDSALAVTSLHTGTLSNNTKYYWKVRALNSGGTSAYSAIRNFTTVIGGPSVPVLLSPANNASGITITPALIWNTSISATSYRLQISLDSAFASTVKDTSAIDTSVLSSLLLNNTKYYWRVNASNAGGTSGYSVARIFTTIIAPPLAPVLAAPLNDAANVPTNTTLSWNNVIGAAAYHFQLAPDSTFSGIVIDSVLAVTSLHADTLLNDTKYYWRVSASNAGGTSGYSTISNFTTIVAPPSAPVLATPVNNAAGVPTNTTLNWSISNGAVSYHVQLAADSTFSSVIIDSTLAVTSLHTSTLSNNTKHYWRVSASNAGGTSGYSTISNFTTIVAPPPAPVLATPVNNATGVPTNTTLHWSIVNGATSYRLQLATDSTFSGIVIDSSVIDTSLHANALLNSTTYYWRVNATNIGGTSLYSAPRIFTTIIGLPSAPVLISPADGGSDISTTPTLVWSKSPGAVSYHAQLSLDSTFASTVNDTSVQDTSVLLNTLLNNTKYYWRVTASNAGGTSGYSTLRNFTTIVAPPSAPIPAIPVNNAAGIPINTTISWNRSNGATSYHLQLTSDSTFAGTVIDSSFADTSLHVTLLNSTTYYWRVNAANIGGSSNYSTIRNFTTIVVTPSAPVLATPVNDATGIPTTTTLSWNNVNSATSYHVQLATDSIFSSVVIDSSLIVTSLHTDTLQNNAKYYWRVNASNAGGTGSYSAVWRFITIIASPSVPVPVTPLNDAVNVPTNTTVTWHASTGANSYRLQLATDSTFSITAIDSSITDTSFHISTLLNNTKYYWRVNATNAGGSGSYSATRNFTTIIASPLPPVLLTPANLDTGITLRPVFTWHISGGATLYRFELSLDSNFSSTVVDSGSINDTSLITSALLSSTTYYWRVNATNLGGTSAFSTGQFSTLTTTDVSVSGGLPRTYELMQNYPNPFNPTTTIMYALPENAHVNIKLYNMLGQIMGVLADGVETAGYKRIQFDANSIPSGMYFYHLSAISIGDAAHTFSQVKKMILIK